MNNLLGIEQEIVCSRNEDLLLECIYRYIDSEDELIYPISESVNNMDEFNMYIPLIESIDEIKEISKDINKLDSEKDLEKKTGLIEKINQSIKKLFDWWFKIEPNKKYKTLRTVLKTLLSIIGIIILIKMPGSKALIVNAAARLPGYTGPSKVLYGLFGRVTIATALIALCYKKVREFIKGLNDKAYQSINSKDIELNINEMDKSIDKLNDLIQITTNAEEKSKLIDMRNDTEDALRELIRCRNQIENDKKPKDSFIKKTVDKAKGTYNTVKFIHDISKKEPAKEENE